MWVTKTMSYIGSVTERPMEQTIAGKPRNRATHIGRLNRGQRWHFKSVGKDGPVHQ